jgi:hypothetical protein
VHVDCGPGGLRAQGDDATGEADQACPLYPIERTLKHDAKQNGRGDYIEIEQYLRNCVG